MKITVEFRPGGEIVQAEAGVSLRHLASVVGIDLGMPCGGIGRCSKCKVAFITGAPSPTSAEREALSITELEQGYRLGCMTVLREDAVVSLSGVSKAINVLASGTRRHVPILPSVSKLCTDVPEPDVDDPRSDLKRVMESLGIGPDRLKMRLSALQEVGWIARNAETGVTGVFHDGNLVSCEHGDTTQHSFGIAFDVGTTTLAGYLIDLRTGEQLAVVSSLNPQTRFGDDVVSRVSFSERSSTNTEVLQRALIDQLNEMIASMCEEAGVSSQYVYDVIVAGNTCMLHLFLGLSPASLAQSPYVPTVSVSVTADASELNLKISRHGKVQTLPSIAGFVGGDTVAVLLATGLYEHEKIVLAVDIGTNGEIVLGSKDRLLACSTAAGPAFEGAHIRHGMRAYPGAIDAAWLDNGELKCSTIGGENPIGICGSGLLDIVASLVRVGVIDQGGRLLGADEVENPLMSSRLRAGEGGNEFVLSGEKGIVLCQRDVRELQLAKGAIRAGIETLMQRLGVRTEDISRILLAGAFGNYIRRENAIYLGLLPYVPLDRIDSVGNAAGEGAKLALISRDIRREADRLAEYVEHVELMLDPGFSDKFADSMILGLIEN